MTSLVEKVEKAIHDADWEEIDEGSPPYAGMALAAIQVVLREMMDKGEGMEIYSMYEMEDFRNMVSAFAKHHHIDLT